MSGVGPPSVPVCSDTERCEYEECGRPSVWTICTDIERLSQKRATCQHHLAKLVPAGMPFIVCPANIQPIEVQMHRLDLFDQLVKGFSEALDSVGWFLFGAIMVLLGHATKLREMVPLVLTVIASREARVLWQWRKRQKQS